MKSKFDAWFIAQHGERPKGPTDEELATQVQRGNEASALLSRRVAWDARFESALYAWQIDDKTKIARQKWR